MSRRRPFRTVLPAAFCAGALTLAACAPGDGPRAGAPPDDPLGSPLTPYLGETFVTGGAMGDVLGVRGEKAPAPDLERQRQAQERIASCMREQGFDYVPVDPATQPPSDFDDIFSLPPEKFAEQFGYGISTFEPGAGGEDDTADLNTKIRAALSSQTQAAYDRALNGEMMAAGPIEVTEGQPAMSLAPEAGGCAGKAFAAVYEQDVNSGALRGHGSGALFDDLAALQKRIDSDPRLDGPRRRWSDCMADAGQVGLKEPSDAPAAVMKRMEQLLGPGAGGPGEMDAGKLAEIRAYELALAPVDLACRKKHWDEEHRRVRFELEQQFVVDHRVELERYRDEMAAARGPAR